MISLSLCMIVREEEAVLRRCLESVAAFVDEIIIVDTGSTDKTKEIALEFTDKLYELPWQDDFAFARNFAFSKATKEYILWLDADDMLPQGEQEKLLALKESLSDTAADLVMLPYDAAFDEWGNVTFTYERERIVRNTPQAKWVGRVHEVIPPFGKTIHEEIHIEHRKEAKPYSKRNLHIYEKMLAEGVSFDAREQFYFAREQYYHGSYQEAVSGFRKVLAEPTAWVENKLEACRYLFYCFSALGKEEEAIAMLLHGLTLAPPGGELCCEIGTFFFQKEDWKQAIFWYENALHTEKRRESGAFIQMDCYGYLPCIQLCVCYDKLGEKERAKLYNDMAGIFKPEDAAVEQNRRYFAETM